MEAWVNRWSRWQPRAIRMGFGAVVAVFLFVVVRFYEPGAGFSYLVTFGAKQNLPQIGEFHQLNYFLQNDGAGYDAQYYVQIAMHPGLQNPELKKSVDSLPYRARRILIGWSSYVMGLGQPAWILQAYALQNVLAWVLLAGLLLHWFPARSWSNLLRWGGVLFCGGMCLSLRHALVDGPSLLLIALGVWCVEKHRPWLATAILALAGLGKETNLLAGAALADPRERTWRAAGRLVIRGLLLLLPLVLWLWYIHEVVGPSIDVGARNFNAPLLSYLTRWRHTLAVLQQSGWDHIAAQASLCTLIALTTQALFFLLRPQLANPWWRVGAAFTVLMVVLGTAVWEGFPGAAARVLLPMQLAFNVLVPHRRRWLAVLVLGNLTVLAAPDFLQPTAGYGYRLHGPSRLVSTDDGQANLRVTFDRNWFEAERKGDRYWRWSRGDATFTIVNPRPEVLLATVTFHVDGLDTRRARLLRGPDVLWTAQLGRDDQAVEVPVELLPGENRFVVATDQPPLAVEGEQGRKLAFALRNLDIRIRGIAPATDAKAK